VSGKGLRLTASRREEGRTDTFDPLSGQPCHVELLILDILDTIDG
jgi:hypothetical protein